MIAGEGLGITYIEGRVKGPLGEEAVRLLMDGEATYTVLPKTSWGHWTEAPTGTRVHTCRWDCG
jgi:hypothetical protein